MVRGDIQAAVSAIAAALDEISHNLPARVVAGTDEQALATRTNVRLAMDNLSARVLRSDQHTSAKPVRGNRKFRGIYRFAGCDDQAHRAPAG